MTLTSLTMKLSCTSSCLVTASCPLKTDDVSPQTNGWAGRSRLIMKPERLLPLIPPSTQSGSVE